MKETGELGQGGSPGREAKADTTLSKAAKAWSR